MFKYLKPYTGPMVTLLLGLGLQVAPLENRMLGGILLGIAFFWLFMALASDRALPRRFPGLVGWMPFLASVGEGQDQIFASRRELEPAHISHKTLRLVDLAGLSGIIREKTVEDCEIFGPAIVSLSNAQATFSECGFDGPPDAVFIVVSPEQQRAIGLIAISGYCVIRRCRMQGIAFLGSRAQIEAARQGVKRLDDAGQTPS